MRLAFPGLMAALAEGATIVTPTPILAAVALEQFNREQLAAGIESWERPDIFSLDAWMTTCWQQGRFTVPNAPSLLSLGQERELWRQIIEHNRPDLFDVRAMASTAQRASRVLAEYHIPTEGEAWSEHADAQNFVGWHQTLQNRLRSENWITRSDLWRLLPAWFNKGVVGPGPVTFSGLSSISPGLQRLKQRCVGITPSIPPCRANAIRFDSVSHELEYAARTTRHLLETSHVHSIGILVADLTLHADDLKRMFREVLYPSAGAHEESVHIQIGSWSDQPVISNALLLLELAQNRIHHASAGAILRCPFIDGASKERSARAMAANRLRRARELDFSLSDIEIASKSCSLLLKTFKRIRIATAKMLQFMRLSDWSATFSDILEAAKWPALENITEAEQRAVDQWKTALSELASLGLVSPPVSFTQALSHLQSILSRPSEQGSWSSPIQVLDANSCEGIEFDHSLILNACEDAWPAPMSLSTLIPYKLQRLHNVPGSHPESAAEERLRKTDLLFTSASTVQLSFTGSLAPLFRSHVDVSNMGSILWDGPTAAQSYSPAALDLQSDQQAPPLIRSDQVSGGSGIIKLQSLCPFRAFVEYRLNARGDDDACFGFDALERGTCAHTALELIWRNLETQATLKALTFAEVQSLVETCVNQAVEDDGSGPIRTLTSSAERERLTSVITNWLEVEKARPTPFTVLHVEQELEVALSGLNLKLRVDRIDRLNNGSLVLIDYKTGVQTKTKLENYRPEEPQLLVYANAVEEPVEGLYFAELRNDRVRAVGHGSGKHFYKQAGVRDHKDEWGRFIGSARNTVQRLATEFVQGDAAVDPIKSACNFCKVKAICRIGPSAAAEEDDE